MLKKIYRMFLLSLMQSKFWHWLLIKIIPFIRFTMYYPKISGRQYHDAYQYLYPGDIILTKDNKKLTTALIGGKWTHAALCVGIGARYKPGYEVAEMTHHGFTKSFFFDICKEADAICILRCNDWDKDYKKKVIENCLNLEGAKYDVEFSLSNIKAFYCSELIYACDSEKRLDVDLSDLAGLGREYLSPTGIYEAKNISVIIEIYGDQ
jgi:uncharacterized protein YycO